MSVLASGDRGLAAGSSEPPHDCPRCPRLVAYREALRAEEPSWHNAPVPSFGDPGARLLVVGLAPGRAGANRTGRPFTGDYAGVVLYPALLRHGFARGSFEARPDDGLELVDCRITNAVRCVPPENKPTGEEAAACRPFLAATIAEMPRLRAILALGRIAHENALRAMGLKPNGAAFAHGAEAPVEGPRGPVTLLSSYHCSRYNVNTNRLTEAMFDAVVGRARRVVDAA